MFNVKIARSLYLKCTLYNVQCTWSVPANLYDGWQQSLADTWSRARPQTETDLQDSSIRINNILCLFMECHKSKRPRSENKLEAKLVLCTLGETICTKFDEFSENFQTASDPLVDRPTQLICISDIYLLRGCSTKKIRCAFSVKKKVGLLHPENFRCKKHNIVFRK